MKKKSHKQLCVVWVHSVKLVDEEPPEICNFLPVDNLYTSLILIINIHNPYK